MTFKKLRPGALQNSVRDAKFPEFCQVIKIRNFWQRDRKFWLYDSGWKHVQQ